MIGGLLETCLYTTDLGRARGFYRRLLDIDPVVDEERICVFRLPDASALILFRQGGTLEPVKLPGGVIPPHDGRGPIHFALAIADDAVDWWRQRLRDLEIGVESEVAWSPERGESLYFIDPDGHVGELATRRIWRNLQG
ncbi:Catechol 2,3-dioxygenase [Fulvimarina manganoxydans]|uniref:Catechol 2,3-dioxygenase n=1 Tax=Fulvimarina manganoxydans TaxID=937218 RepID=A0A1W2E2H6_9HYPH|nr:VOC family protein [Fulvimarina manganoxydans]MEE2953525.1 VOC family protein [Pseudomonadota bacterium]SMD03925.1 Catechol 2,3-dioxygenase [Fulvimarina manganoxydans]